MLNAREVTIGRSMDCDIYLDQSCIYASSHHAVIYSDGYQLMFRDTSSNGTVINNTLVKNGVVPICHGDIILLAGQYQLNWNQIDSFFGRPNEHGSTVLVNPSNYYVNSQLKSDLSAPAEEPDLKSWNWGAFSLYWIWGFFNGCPWLIVVSLFLGWAFPIPNIILGMKGTRMSWEKKKWESVKEFNKSKETWDFVGKIMAVLFFVSFFFSWLLIIVSIFASFG